MFLKKRDNFIVHLSITSVDVLFVKKNKISICQRKRFDYSNILRSITNLKYCFQAVCFGNPVKLLFGSYSVKYKPAFFLAEYHDVTMKLTFDLWS